MDKVKTKVIGGIRWQPKGYSAEDWIASHKGVFYHALTARRFSPSVASNEKMWIAGFTIWSGSRQTLLSVRGFKTMRGAVTRLVMLTRKMGVDV